MRIAEDLSTKRSAVVGVSRGVHDALYDSAPQLPAYLVEHYSWAYLRPKSLRYLDNDLVVSSILWGNYRRLMAAAIGEFEPDWRVLQPACVYGELSPRLARHLEPKGELTVTDIAPVQLENCRHKLRSFRNVRLGLEDAAAHAGAGFDAVCCFFLLHELPADHRDEVVTSLLSAVRPGGRIVFVDYHKPRRFHPLAPVMRLIFHHFEPFALDLWQHDIESYGERSATFDWRKQTYFGGLYQKCVAIRR